MTVDDSQGSSENMRKVGMLFISVMYLHVQAFTSVQVWPGKTPMR